MRIQVQLFGADTPRTTTVETRGGFPTRHLRVGSVDPKTGETVITIQKPAKPTQSLQELLAEVDAIMEEKLR